MRLERYRRRAGKAGAEGPSGEGNALGQLIRDYRMTAGMSLRQLAERLGMHYSMLARLETGERLPRRFLPRIAELLGLEPAELELLTMLPRRFPGKRSLGVRAPNMASTEHNQLSQLELLLLGFLRGGPLSWPDLLVRGRNADPRRIEDSLARLRDLNLLTSQDASYSLNRKALDELGIELFEVEQDKVLEVGRQILERLPTPAPIFSQWWFPPEVIGKIVELIARAHPVLRSICFIGAPSLAATMASVAKTKVTIVDSDPAVCDAIREHLKLYTNATIVHSDVRTYRPTEAHDLVYADPPWDFATLRAFILTCPRLITSEGYLYVSYPGEHTRASIPLERAYLEMQITSEGMAPVSWMQDFLSYQIPQFEAAAYADIVGFPKSPWRRGDLAVYQRCENQFTDLFKRRGIARAGLSGTAEWNEYSIGKRRVFLRLDSRARGTFPPTISRLYTVDTKPSTSSRDIKVPNIGLWTSKNETFATEGESTLQVILELFAKGQLEFEKTASVISREFGKSDPGGVARDIKDVYWELRRILEV